MSGAYAEVQPKRAEIDALAGSTVLEFGNDWCGHCRRAHPLIAEALSGYPDLAAEELSERAKERYDELVDEVGEDVVKAAARRIALRHLDRRWTDHLAYLADIRESIHLRALGRQNPLDEFHRMAVDAFASLAADAIEAAQQTFETADSIEDEPGVDLSKLARPTSTWTYMVHDNPLADDTMSALSLPGVFR